MSSGLTRGKAVRINSSMKKYDEAHNKDASPFRVPESSGGVRDVHDVVKSHVVTSALRNSAETEGLNDHKIRRIIGCGTHCTSVDGVETTPEMAAELLKYNSCNRPIRAGSIKKYVMSMRTGNWHRDSDSISFNSNGVLTNGQHILMSVVESGCKVLLDYKFGVEAHPDMDTGASRSLRDNAIMLDGNERIIEKKYTKAYKVISAAIKVTPSSYTSSVTLTNDFEHKMLEKYADDLIELIDAKCFAEIGVITVDGRSKKLTSTPTFLAMFEAYECGVKIEVFQRIVEVLRNSATSEPHNRVILTLRDLLISASGNSAKYKYIRYCAMEACIKAVSAHSTSKKLNYSSPCYNYDFFKGFEDVVIQ